MILPLRPLLLAILPLCLVALLTACNLERRARDPASDAPTPAPAGPPSIQITAPNDGAEFVIGDEILVSVLAADSVGVNRVQLFVNDQIVRTVSSESLQGDLSLPAVLNYSPRRADIGTIHLRAYAYRHDVVSEADEIAVVVRESPAQVLATPALQGIPFIPDDGVCRALVNVGLNFRAGPGAGYRVYRVLPSGTLAAITGRNREHSWWRLRVDNQTGWVSGDYTAEYGDCSAVAVVAG